MTNPYTANVDTGRARTIRYLALAVGIVYAIIGVVGFFVTGLDNFASPTGKTLLGLEINPLHNIVHVATGIVGIVMSRTLSAARAFGWLLVVVYGVVFLYGLFAIGQPDVNFLSINWGDNWLHLVTVLVGLLIALVPATAGARARSMP